jgi:hypothetical protein
VKTSIKFVFSTLTLGVAVAVSGIAVAQTPNPGSAPSASASDSFPVWAYPWDPDFKSPPADDAPHRLPGSTATFKWPQVRDLFFSPDWHPEDHPPLPAIGEAETVKGDAFPSARNRWFRSDHTT